MTNSRWSHVFDGYAAVSADGFIADAEGRMPEALKFDADWDYFQTALDQADVTLIGRRTHEAAPNVKNRARLVFTSRVDGLDKDDEVTCRIDPARADPCAALAERFGRAASVAVVGGQGVFDWVLSNPGFSAFHLSLAHDVRLERGRTMFKQAFDLETGVALLRSSNMRLSHQTWLDRDAGLELLVYRRGRS